MSALNELETKRQDLEKKMKNLLINGKCNQTNFEKVGSELNVTGQTVKNYVNGKGKDGYLAEAIYKEFKRLKLIK